MKKTKTDLFEKRKTKKGNKMKKKKDFSKKQSCDSQIETGVSYKAIETGTYNLIDS